MNGCDCGYLNSMIHVRMNNALVAHSSVVAEIKRENVAYTACCLKNSCKSVEVNFHIWKYNYLYKNVSHVVYERFT